MIRLHDVPPHAGVLGQLAAWQALVDGEPDYAGQVERAKKEFSARNTRSNETFSVVKASLTAMCAGARRCMYCEDSYADEVEHFRPKDLYPDRVFAWPNYLFACGPCNGPKNNQFAVFVPAGTSPQEVTRKRGDPVTKPPVGDPVLIDPRLEDPLEFMVLDLRETFRFVAHPLAGMRDRQRAEYTIAVCGLNARDDLVRARQEALDNYRARLVEYVHRKAQGSIATELQNLATAIQRMAHPTVWQELKRQRQPLGLDHLFSQAPESLQW